MAKYNVGDVLVITEDFALECAVFSEGEKYSVVEVGERFYYLESAEYYYTNTISEVDDHPGFRKVEPKVEFKVGDKVRLLETAHGSPGYSTDTPEAVKERLAGRGLDYQAVFEVDQEADFDGDVHLFHAEKYTGLYVLPEFLVLAGEVDKSGKHMELGKTYQSILNELYYRVDQFDFYNSQVLCSYGHEPDVGQYLKTERNFFEIEEEFGVLPPVKPVGVSQVALDELKEQLKPENTLAEVEQEDVGGWDREEYALDAPKPETVSVDALREAYEYVDHEYLDLEKMIELAKRLS